jgi:hypothetical protein
MNKLTAVILSVLLSMTAFAGGYEDIEDWGGYRRVATNPMVPIIENVHSNQLRAVDCYNCQTASDYMWAGLAAMQNLRPGDWIKVSNPARTVFYIVELYPILIESDEWAINFNFKTPLGAISIGGAMGQIDPDQIRIVVNSVGELAIDRKMSKNTFRILFPHATNGMIVRPTPLAAVYMQGGNPTGFYPAYITAALTMRGYGNGPGSCPKGLVCRYND